MSHTPDSLNGAGIQLDRPNTSRIYIFGASGSGVTTLGKHLGAALHLAVFDVDFYFWEATEPPYQFKTTVPSRISAIKADMTQHENRWILSGSVGKWGQELLQDVEHVFFVYTPPGLRMERLKKRERDRYGDRLDPGGDMAEQSKAFLEWAEMYDEGGDSITRTLKEHRAWLKDWPGKVTELDGTKTWEEVLKDAILALENSVAE